MSLVNPDDSRFLAPANMPEAIRDYCRETGQHVPADEGEVVRCALESIALKYRQVLGWLEELTGAAIKTIHIVGGGTQNRQLCQMAADACGRRVVAGPVEATAIGNLMVQAIASGEVASIGEAREVIRRSFSVETYEPRDTGAWDEAYGRFLAIVVRSDAANESPNDETMTNPATGLSNDEQSQLWSALNAMHRDNGISIAWPRVLRMGNCVRHLASCLRFWTFCSLCSTPHSWASTWWGGRGGGRAWRI